MFKTPDEWLLSPPTLPSTTEATMHLRPASWSKGSALEAVSLGFLYLECLSACRSWRLQLNITFCFIWSYEHMRIFFFASSVRKPLTSSNMTEPDVYHVQHLQDQTQRAPPLCFCCGCEMGHPVRDHWWSRLQGADIDDTSHPDRKQAHLWVCCVQYQNEGPWLHLDLQVEEQREEPGHMGPGRCGSTVRSKGDPHAGTLFPSAPGGTQGGFFVRSLDCSQAH